MSTPNVPDQSEIIRQRAEACERIVSEFKSGLFPDIELFTRLQATGISPEEANDYIEQIERSEAERDTLLGRGGQGDDDGGRSRGPTPPAGSVHGDENEGHGDGGDGNRRSAEMAADATAWALIKARLANL